MNIVIFGPQGSGKGTQANLLARKHSLQHIETGHIFRRIAEEDTLLGKIIKDFNEKKDMIPDDITIDVLQYYLEKVPQDKGIILDSAPRTEGQIVAVEKMLENIGKSFDKAIYITLPYEKSLKRISKRYICSLCHRHFVIGREGESAKKPCLTCGGPLIKRVDDTPEGIAKRLKVFYEVTIPVIDYYRKKGILIEVNGDQEKKKVFNDIVEKLQDFQ